VVALTALQVGSPGNGLQCLDWRHRPVLSEL
jgi:hypothetical protein